MSDNMNYTQSSATNTESSSSQATATPEYTNSNTPQREDLKINLEELKQLLSEQKKIEALEKDIATLKRQVKKLKEEKVKFYHFIEMFIAVILFGIIIIPLLLIASMIYFSEFYLSFLNGFLNNPLTLIFVGMFITWVGRKAIDAAKKSFTTKDEDFE